MREDASQVMIGKAIFTGAAEATLELGKPPRIQSILRLFQVVEGLVLYDRVTLLMPDRKKKDGKDNKSQVVAHAIDALTSVTPFWKKLQSEGVFDQIETSQAFNLATERQRSGQQDTHTLVEQLLSIIAAPDKSRELLISDLVNMSYIPDSDQLEALMKAEKLRMSRVLTPALHKAYSQLSATLRGEIAELEKSGRPVEIYIPPIPAIVLDRVSEPGELLEAVMELRDELQNVRNAFRDYEMAIADDSLSVGESLGALRRLHEVSTELSKKHNERSSLVINEWRDLVKLLPGKVTARDIEGLAQGELIKLLTRRPAEILANALRNRRVLYLLKLRDLFLNIKHYGTLLSKVYKIDLTDQDISKWRSASDAVEQYIQYIAEPRD